jgi:hypothetical protein
MLHCTAQRLLPPPPPLASRVSSVTPIMGWGGGACCFFALLCSRGEKLFHAKLHSALLRYLAALCSSSVKHARLQCPLALHHEFVHLQLSTPSPTGKGLNPAPTKAVVLPVCVPPSTRCNRGETIIRCAARATRPLSPAGAGGGCAPCDSGPCVCCRRSRRDEYALCRPRDPTALSSRRWQRVCALRPMCGPQQSSFC